MNALGMIETRGLIGAVESADAMLKAAEVRLLEKHMIGGGLVTITVAGKVAAVQAAVDAALVSVGRIKGAVLVSGHVIARPDQELAHILFLEEEPGTDAATTSVALSIKKGAIPPATGAVRSDPAQYKKMSLNRLRQLATSLQGIAIAPEHIASADRKALIDAIIHAYKQ